MERSLFERVTLTGDNMMWHWMKIYTTRIDDYKNSCAEMFSEPHEPLVMPNWPMDSKHFLERK